MKRLHYKKKKKIFLFSYNKMIELDSYDKEGFEQKGTLCTKLEKYDEAMKWF